jgi:lipid-A-disaccharide synthase-like uncharacterized protein
MMFARRVALVRWLAGAENEERTWMPCWCTKTSLVEGMTLLMYDRMF